MKKQQFLLIGVSILFIILILAFGNFIPPKQAAVQPPNTATASIAFTTQDVLEAAKSKLSPERQERITNLENNVVRGDVKGEQIKTYKLLEKFWTDSIHNIPLGTHYNGEIAKLENSEQSLTFAARKLLSFVMSEQSKPLQAWMANDAKELFEQALKINPADDSAQVGLGGCYMFGNISDNPMQEILKVRAIAEKNPDNLYAQMMLGLGGMQSGQYENAIKRFLVVVNKQPDNLDAALDLADAYDRIQDKPNAIKWYKVVKEKIPSNEAKTEIAKHIEELEN
ncbi:MAG: tetratricopeptide repeat protein [Arachidicoccus sp.]|nr:tetratricopeptide repeat protein [Arachidicoccus sp.]